MEFYYFAGGLIVVIVIVYYFIFNKTGKPTNSSINKVKESLENICKGKDNCILSLNNNQNYDLLLELTDKVYLIKVITINKEQEIVITNKVTWIVNSKKNTPNIKNKIPGIKEFIEYESPINKKVKKVAVVYPSAHNILKFINENEMVIVNPKIDVHGCRIIQYSNLSEIETI